MDTHHTSTGVIGMYYGPNYDTSSVGVVPSVSHSMSSPVLHSVSSSLPPADQLSDEELCESDEPSDDDGDWITPDNLQKACEQMGGATTTSAKDVTVGCLTTDFTMQV